MNNPGQYRYGIVLVPAACCTGHVDQITLQKTETDRNFLTISGKINLTVCRAVKSEHEAHQLSPGVGLSRPASFPSSPDGICPLVCQ